MKELIWIYCPQCGKKFSSRATFGTCSKWCKERLADEVYLLHYRRDACKRYLNRKRRK